MPKLKTKKGRGEGAGFQARKFGAKFSGRNKVTGAGRKALGGRGSKSGSGAGGG